MNAREITKALAGRWHGNYGLVKCPTHDDHIPSLKVSDAEHGGIIVFVLPDAFGKMSRPHYASAACCRTAVQEQHHDQTPRPRPGARPSAKPKNGAG